MARGVRAELVGDMSEEKNDALVAYVESVSELIQMPLNDQRARAVAAVMARIADFAGDVGALALADDVEIAGIFTP
jgi:hypothetical protein